MSDRLLDQLRESDKIKPALPRAFAHEFSFSRLGHRKAQLVSADALRLQRKAGGALKVRTHDPQLPGLFVGSADFAYSVVVDDGGASFFTGQPSKEPVRKRRRKVSISRLLPSPRLALKLRHNPKHQMALPYSQKVHPDYGRTAPRRVGERQ